MFERLCGFGWYDKIVQIIEDEAINSLISSVIISAILTPIGLLLYWICGGESGSSILPI